VGGTGNALKIERDILGRKIYRPTCKWDDNVQKSW
jgi:hypothetical protein